MGVAPEIIRIRIDFDPEPVTAEGSSAIPEASRRRVDIFVDY